MDTAAEKDNDTAAEKDNDTKMVLVFDTETTGLVSRRFGGGQPYLVQLSFILYNMNTNVVEAICDSVTKIPEHVVIPTEAFELHKIDRARMDLVGVSIKPVLEEFCAT